MSCHTLCYTKLKETNSDSIKTELINYFKENIEKGKNILKNSQNQKELSEWNTYLEYAEPQLYSLEINDLNKEELYELYEDLNDNLIIHENKIYTETEFNDIFRISGFPEDVLTSKEQNIQYIKDNTCHIYDLNAIEDFWKKYPEGLIYFA